MGPTIEDNGFEVRVSLKPVEEVIGTSIKPA